MPSQAYSQIQLTSAPPSPAQETAAPSPVARPACHILIVDDEENVVSILKANLRKLAHCEVSGATSGEQALQILAQHPCHLLIADYKMPRMDGLTLATRVRQLYPATAIILITAHGSEQLRDRAVQASIEIILDKPVQMDELRAAALRALQCSEEKQNGGAALGITGARR